MGQIEVYEFLKNKRLQKDDSFWSCKSVEKALLDEGLSCGVVRGVRGDLLRLEISGYLEPRIHEKSWVRCWRLKSKYARLKS